VTRLTTYLTIALAMALLLRPHGAVAQDTAAVQNPPVFSVSVTESSELVEFVGTTRRLTRADIQARSARTLDDALRLLPGVFVRTGGDGTPRIDVRGFRSRHVLLLINGVPANSTSDGQFDPARISTAGIREIKVSYGSSSVLYGDNALAAVIEITTVDSRPDAVVEVSAGTPELEGIDGRYARTVGNWSLTTTGAAFNSEGFSLPGSFTPTSVENGGRRDNSDRDRRELRAALGYSVSPTFVLTSEWAVNAGSYGVPASAVNDSSDVFAQMPRFERVTGYQQWSGQASANLKPLPRLNLRAWVYHHAQHDDRSRYDDSTYTNMDDPLVSGTFQSLRTGSRRPGQFRLAARGAEPAA
jgi:vitamin B12 transporter